MQRPLSLATTLVVGLIGMVCVSCSDDGVNEGGSKTAAIDAAGDGGACGSAKDCPDPTKPCTKAVCTAAGECETTIDKGSACDDGDACTAQTTCTAEGKCSGGVKTCSCLKSSDCGVFEDGNACNGTLFCDKTTVPYGCRIKPGSRVTCASVNDTVCSQNRCDPAIGTCASKAVNDGAACQDGDPCTTGDVCKGGACKKGPASICQCKVTSDCAAYEDQDACNGTLYCDKLTFPYTCRVVPKTVVTCPFSKDACAPLVCDAGTGKCVGKPVVNDTTCDDGDKCTAGETCQKGVCSGGKDICSCTKHSDCDAKEDGDLCNGTLYCDKAAGSCKVNKATVITCASASDTACTKNLCNAKTGQCSLQPVKNGAACEDGNSCTTGDICLQGSCQKGTNTCTCKDDKACAGKDDGNACNGTVFCNKATGKCEVNPATIVVCPTVGDTACTKNVCRAKVGKCAATPRNLVKSVCDKAKGGAAAKCVWQEKGPDDAYDGPWLCDDGNPCTKGDACAGSVCKSGTKTCFCQTNADCLAEDDGDYCNGVPYCDKAGPQPVCKSNPASKVSCLKNNDTACLKNLCNPVDGKCALKPANAGKPCNDGSVCTVGENCNNVGLCIGATKTCDDGNACTKDSCDPGSAGSKTGAGCVHKQLVCDDGNACTVDACDKGSGQCAKPVAKKDGALCDADLNPCTVADACKAGSCVTGSNVTCVAPANPCQISKCVAQSKTEFKCLAVPKSDGTACPEGDKGCWVGSTCKSGGCKTGTISRYRKVFYGDAKERTTFNAIDKRTGGLVMVGHRVIGSPTKITERRPWIVATDALGKQVWEKTFIPKHPHPEASAVDVVAAADGSVWVAMSAAMAKGRRDALLAQYDAKGKRTVTFSVPNATGTDRRIGAFDRLAGGASVLVGGYVAKANEPDVYEPLVIRLSATGNVVAVITQKDFWFTRTHGVAAKMFNDGGFLAVHVSEPRAKFVHQSDLGGWSATRYSVSGKKLWSAAGGLFELQLDPKTNQSKLVNADKIFGADARQRGSVLGVAVGFRRDNALYTRFIELAIEKGALLGQRDDKGTATYELVANGSHTAQVGTVAVGGQGQNASVVVRDKFFNAHFETSYKGNPGKLDDAAVDAQILAGGDLAIAGFAGVAAATKKRAMLAIASPFGHLSCTGTGACQGKTWASCNDGKSCTVDSCHPKTGCTNDPKTGLGCPPSGICAATAHCNDAGKCEPDAAGKLLNHVTSPTKQFASFSHGWQVADNRYGLYGKGAAGGSLAHVHPEQTFMFNPDYQCGMTHVRGAAPGAAGTFVQYGDTSQGSGFCWFTEKSNGVDFISMRPVVFSGYKTTGQGFVVAPDGTFMLLSRRTKGASTDVVISRLAADTKTFLWQSAAYTSNTATTANGVTALSNGGAVAVGSVVVAGKKNALITAVGDGGKKRYSQAIDGGHSDELFAVTETPDGGVIAVGETRTNLKVYRRLMLRVDQAGKLLWKYSPALADRAGFNAVVSLGDGTFTLLGAIAPGNASKVLLTHIAADGATIWERQIGQAFSILPSHGGLRRLADGGYLLLGYGITAGRTVGWFSRTDAWGHADCKLAGKCAGKAKSICDDANPCTSDLCDATSGTCKHAKLSGTFCAPGKVCKSGVCLAK